MARMVCVKCQTFLHPKKNGVWIEEGMPRGSEWVPYKLWHADAWECRSCGVEIVAGFGDGPFAEHYQPNYQALKASRRIHVFVKDCM